MVWELTRRTFTAGLGGAVSRVVAGPVVGGHVVPTRVSGEVEATDAYERLLSEYVRIEEAAIAAGETTGGGASTFVGRQLETFIGDLDSGVDLGTRAGEIYDRLRERLRRAVERLAEERDAPADVVPNAEASGTAEPGAEATEAQSEAPEPSLAEESVGATSSMREVDAVQDAKPIGG